MTIGVNLPDPLAKAHKAAVVAVLHASLTASTRSVTDPASSVDVCLTTYGARTSIVSYTIESIAQGRLRPRRLILVISDPDFSLDRYPMLKRLTARGLEIVTSPDWGPYKKSYPYAADLADGVTPLVTADDDTLYPPSWLDGLARAARRHPGEVLGYRGHRILWAADGTPRPYREWVPATPEDGASCSILLTGVGGVLMPPALLARLKSQGTAFRELAPRADDLWFNAQADEAGLPRRVIPLSGAAITFPRSQESGLAHSNVDGGGNDEQIRSLVAAGLLQEPQPGSAPAEHPRLRILIFAFKFFPSRGGVEITAELLARGFSTTYGDDVVVVTTSPSEESDAHFPFTVLRSPSPRVLAAAVKGADVILHNNPVLTMAWPQLLTPRPWVVAMRSWICPPDRTPTWRDRLKISLVGLATRKTANATPLSHHVSGPMRVIHNSYRDEIFFTTNPPESRPLDRLLYVGRLAPEKGADLLLEALKLLKDRGRGLSLTLVGGGADEIAFYQEMAERLGVTDCVEFLGELQGPQLNEVMNRYAIAVIPSVIAEPFGTVALEEIAAGCIPVVADHGGLPEAIGPAGLKFTPRDAVSLADAVERAIDDADLRSRLRAAGPGHAANHRGPIMVASFREELVKAMEDWKRS